MVIRLSSPHDSTEYHLRLHLKKMYGMKIMVLAVDEFITVDRIKSLFDVSHTVVTMICLIYGD